MDLIKYNYYFLILSWILYKKKKYNSPIIVPQISFQDITKSSKHFEESRENSCFNRGRFGRRTQVTKGNRCHGGARLRANRWTINRRLHGDNGNAVNLEAHSRRIAATNYDPPPLPPPADIASTIMAALSLIAERSIIKAAATEDYSGEWM